MSRDRELGRALREIAVPGEAEAEARSWEVVRAAHAEREPLRPPVAGKRLALAAAAGLALLAIGLSPAGAKVGEAIEEVLGIGAEDAAPTLRSLPAAGELLVESADGPWIVREDGSKRLLGDYGEATWSPRGLFVAATDGHQLVAVDPLGEVRWTITAPAPANDPRWAPSGYRIAYRSGDDLWVVAGDGTGARRIARNVAPVAPAWRPIGSSKLAAAPGLPGANVLTYLDRERTTITVDVDTGEELAPNAGDYLRISAARSHGPVRRTVSPDGETVASLRRPDPFDSQARSTDANTQLVLQSRPGAPRRVVFAAPGKLTGPTWSPDGRWLLVGWPAADQWLFIDIDRPRRVVAFDAISEQFDPGGDGRAPFPGVSGWILPEP